MAKSIKMKAILRKGTLTLRALIRHPMKVSLRDPDTGELTPGHFIQEVICRLNGEVILQAHWGQGISKNPYLSFRYQGASPGDRLSLEWRDNRGRSDAREIVIE